MKGMKWFLVLAIGIAMGLSATGCGGGGGDDDPLVGTWEATAFNGQALPAGISMTMTLQDDGTYTATTVINGAPEIEAGTWSAANGVLTTVFGGETDTAPYGVDGDTLTIGIEGDVITAERQ